MTVNNLSPQCYQIVDKVVWVVDDHQYALLIWGQLARAQKCPMVLVSIDYHPDTNPPFWLQAYQKAMAIDPEREVLLVEKFTQKMMAQIDPDDLDSVRRVMVHLRNDEHIHTAVACGYLEDYHMINCMEKHHYSMGNHYLVEKEHFGSLEDKMFEASGFAMEDIRTKAIILDIDLDYFVSPKNFELALGENKYFAELVNRAQIITVARSKNYFDFLKTDAFSIEVCEKKLIQLLEKIVTGNEKNMDKNQKKLDKRNEPLYTE